jgi:CheY-like chemotaxis protein
MDTAHRPLNILLVEDNSSDAELMEIALRKSALSFKLNICQDGEEATDYLFRTGSFQEAERPDVILLDINLPKKTGHEVLREIKSDDSLREVPVIVLTTTALERDIRKVTAYPQTRFLTKPFRFDEYKKVIQMIEDFVLVSRQA